MSAGIWELTFYAGAIFILFITPGPVWLAIVARSLSGGFSAAWPLAFGVMVGDIVWPLLAILGVSWIVSVFDGFLDVLRWVACGMFIAMGVLLIKHAGKALSSESKLTRPGVWAGFLAGLIAILGNPKAILFYMGVLPGFFDLETITNWDIVAIVVISMIVPFLGNLLLASFVDRIRRLLQEPSQIKRLNIASGSLLIVVGALIPLVA
ncbi:MAG: LysE family translocator [Paracoccaceae bacterium]|nr:LysE family translocator [Paracoccaceae bacterium]MDG2257125.1 LysE family translocator [Paracoccaceae bacterium]